MEVRVHATTVLQVGSGAGSLAAVDWLVLFAVLILSMVVGVLFYRSLLRPRVRAGGHPAALRWLSIVTSFLVLILLTSLLFWERLPSWDWWPLPETFGPALLWVLAGIWLVSLSLVLLYDRRRRFM